MTRTQLIAEIVDEIACGTPSGKFDAAYFLDTLMDEQRVTCHDVAVLLTMNELSEAHTNVADRMREQITHDAIEFFTNDQRGIDHIDDLMAEAERERQADEEFERKYGEAA